MTWRFKTRAINDDTYTYAPNKSHDWPVDRSLGNCKYCDGRRLFDELRDSGEPIDSGGTRWRAPRSRDCPRCRCSVDNGSAVYDASNQARCHSPDHRAPFTSAHVSSNDIANPCRAYQHADYTSCATARVSAASGGQPVCEHAARSGLLQCLLF